MSILTTRRSLAILVAASTLLVSALSLASQADASAIYACVKKKSGTARFVTKKAKCKKGESKISWNNEGPAGKPGANGATGATGAKGETGVKGETGPPPTSLWAVVSAGAELSRGGGGAVSAAQPFGVGTYEVVFNRDVSKCSYVATIGNTGAGNPPVGEIGVAQRLSNPDAVYLQTYNIKAEKENEPFHLAVFC